MNLFTQDIYASLYSIIFKFLNFTSNNSFVKKSLFFTDGFVKKKLKLMAV
jgi:hypothetical protein